MMRKLSAVGLVLLLCVAAWPAPPRLSYEKKRTREETILASLKASGLPTLEGKWHYIGPFDNTDNLGFDTAYPPEKEIDLAKTYAGKGGKGIGWKEFPDFKIGHVNNLARFPNNNDSCIYLYHEIEVKEALTLPLSLGSDDTLTVWLNGELLLAQNVVRA